MLFIQPWAFLLQFFAIILAGCAKNYFLFVLGKTWRGELGAENLFERGGRAYGVVSEFVKSAFEHVVQDQLHVLALSCVGVAEMEARRHLKLGTFLNNGNWKKGKSDQEIMIDLFKHTNLNASNFNDLVC